MDTRQIDRKTVTQRTKDKPDGRSIGPGPALSRVYLFDLGQPEPFDWVGLLHPEDKGSTSIGLLDYSRNSLFRLEGTGGQPDIDLPLLYRFDASCAADTGEDIDGDVGVFPLKTLGHPSHNAGARTCACND